MLSKSATHLSAEFSPKDGLLSSSFDLVLSSPSKVNLFFRVISKRPDGFHEIASLYQAVGLYDTLYFRKSSHLSVTCSNPSLSTGESNLVTKAARLFFQKTGMESAADIHLVKNIPVEAGLGGGSGDAATTLWGLNELYGRPAGLSELMEWGATLGSDVAFFFSSGCAYCTGRGEKLESLPPMDLPVKVTIVKPKEGLSTPLVYKNCRVENFPLRSPEESLISFQQGKGDFYNDLEIPAFSLLPSLKEIKTLLESAGFSHALMCGSGTAFFCLGEGSLEETTRWQVYNARFIHRKDGDWYE